MCWFCGVWHEEGGKRGEREGGVLLGVREAWCWAVDVVRRVWKGRRGAWGLLAHGHGVGMLLRMFVAGRKSNIAGSLSAGG